MPTSLALKTLAFDSTSCCSCRSPEHEMPKLRHYWCWWVQGMRQSFPVGGKRARRPCPCLGAENSLEPAGHTDGHKRSLRISLFTRRLTETNLCVGTCDVSSSILRFAIERPLWKIQATTLSTRWSLSWFLSFTACMDSGQGPWTHGVGQDASPRTKIC